MDFLGAIESLASAIELRKVGALRHRRGWMPVAVSQEISGCGSAW
jgi:hypothetical protein